MNFGVFCWFFRIRIVNVFFFFERWERYFRSVGWVGRLGGGVVFGVGCGIRVGFSEEGVFGDRFWV